MLVDTSVFIAAERGQLDFDHVMATHGTAHVALAAITAAELLHGLYRATTPTQRTQREAFVERVLATLPVLAFDLVVARLHARLWAELAMQGITVGTHDLLIAATALRGCPETFSHRRREITQHSCGNETKGDRKERVCLAYDVYY